MEKDWFILHIDDHRMWVTLALKEPIGEEAPYISPALIEAFLRENGITAGIIEEALIALSDHISYEQEILVAKGKEPINGKNGYFQFTSMIEDAKSKPVVNPDGSVDYINSLKLAMVNQDELFALYIPATAGEYGYTVFSEMLPPVKGKEQRALRGKGFYVSEDGREYRASYKGRITKTENRITVEKLYVVKGDLDIEKGNLNFNGDVEIMGDVRSGLSIVADGSIFVHGHVGGSNLTAGGNITIRKGIQGKNKCEIHADGDVACSFVERCTIFSKGIIYADSILDSTVTAKQKVIVSSKKGLVVGGCITGVQGITVKEAGNDKGILTTLQAGMIQEESEQATLLSEQRLELAEKIKLLEKNLKAFEALPGEKRTKETEAIKTKLIRAKIIEMTELKNLDMKISELNKAILTARKEAQIQITGISHAGIKINIGKNSFVPKETWKDVVYKNINDCIYAQSGEGTEYET